jgi:putative MATE family efflux protein
MGNLWSLSWPALISTSINSLGPTIDMIWVGKLGSSSIAGVGVSALAIQVINSFIMGLFPGTSAMVARFMGAKDEANANRVAQQSYIIAASFSFVMAVIGIVLSEKILILLGVEPEVVSEGAAYMRIQLVGIVTMSVLQVSQNIMQASGDTRTPLKIGVSYRILQIILCPALVFGWWLFPDMGVKGAALSNVLAQGLGGVIALWALMTGRSRLTVTFKDFHFDRSLIWRTIRIGIPSSITSMERNFAALVLVKFITPFGTVAVAAHALSQRVDQFIQMLANGLGTPAGVLAGQNLGAGRPERSARTAWLAAGLATGISIGFSIIIWFWVEYILRIFNSEPDLVGTAATFLRIEITAYLVWGAVITFTQVLNGIGDTLIPMITNMVTVWAVQMPLAYFLPGLTGLGVYGVRWAMVAGILGRGVIYPLYFKTGRWKHRKV